MFSFHIASPAGVQVEVGHGARPIAEDWDENRGYDRIRTRATNPSPPGSSLPTMTLTRLVPPAAAARLLHRDVGPPP